MKYFFLLILGLSLSLETFATGSFRLPDRYPFFGAGVSHIEGTVAPYLHFRLQGWFFTTDVKFKKTPPPIEGLSNPYQDTHGELTLYLGSLGYGSSPLGNFISFTVELFNEPGFNGRRPKNIIFTELSLFTGTSVGPRFSLGYLF